MNQTVKPELKNPLSPSELMIGNLVLDSTGNTTVVESIIPDHERVRFGIPLTEERLLSFGFEKILGKMYSEHIILMPVSDTYYIALLGDKIIKITTVHQLQNLCYAISGEKLSEKRR